MLNTTIIIFTKSEFVVFFLGYGGVSVVGTSKIHVVAIEFPLSPAAHASDHLHKSPLHQLTITLHVTAACTSPRVHVY